MTKEELERYLAEGLSLAQIAEQARVAKSTVSYQLRKHGLKPLNHGRAANKGALGREDLAAMVNEGLTLAEMARRVDRSVSTVRYWLKKYGCWPLPAADKRARVRLAREQGVKSLHLDCGRHGRTEFVIENSGRARCLKCRREAVIQWRRRAKLQLVAEAGGRCVLCGYHEFPGALQFHHLDPSQKSFGLAMRGLTRSIERLREEAAKCVLLCANCHAKVEWGPADADELAELAPQSD
jgi:DNA-binding CsgD family transcriptional regulator/5-methylcytosine-specific restriction endonuclease McrA